MSHNGYNDNFYPDDVFGAGQASDSVRADIRDAIDATDNDNLPMDLLAARVFIHKVTLDVLGDLSDEGIEEADVLKADMESVDPVSEPHRADLSMLAFDYDEKSEETDDPVERRKIRDLGAVAHATYPVTTIKALADQAIREDKLPTEMANFEFFVDYSRESIAEANIPESTKDVLKRMVQKIIS